jgi:hypothetical protein
VSTAPARAGLCALCRHGREVRSDRDSRFWLCRRSEDDPRYPRYPRLPVLQCPGFQPEDEEGGVAEDGEDGDPGAGPGSPPGAGPGPGGASP